MRPRHQLSPALVKLAADQDGVLSRAQALPELGVHAIRRLVRAEQWSVVTPGVLALAATPSVRHRLWAGVLLGGPDAALGGESALFLAGLRPEPTLVETWVPMALRRQPRPGWAFPRDGWGRLAHTWGTLPAIRLEEALIDVGQGLEVEGWVELLSDAVRSRVVSLAEVERRVRARPRVRGRTMLLDVLSDFQGIESNLEWAYLRGVEQRHGLPSATRQVVAIAGSRSDVRYEGFGLIVELDGKLHLGQEFRDMNRDNAHVVRGDRTLRYGSPNVRGTPCLVAWQVAGVLRRQGWDGVPVRCSHCPAQADLDAVAGFT